MATTASKYNCFALSSEPHKEGYSEQIIELAKNGKTSSNYHFLQKYIDKILTTLYRDLENRSKQNLTSNYQTIAGEYFISGSRGSGKTTILQTLKKALSSQKRFLVPDYTINLSFHDQNILNLIMICIEENILKQDLICKSIANKFKKIKNKMASDIKNPGFKSDFNQFIDDYLKWMKKDVLILFVDDLDLIPKNQIISFLKSVNHYLYASNIKLFCFGDWENVIRKLKHYSKECNHKDYSIVSSFHEKVFPSSGITKIKQLDFNQLSKLNIPVKTEKNTHLNEIKPFFEVLKMKNRLFSVLGENHFIFKTLFSYLNLRQLNQFILKLEIKSKNNETHYYPPDHNLSDIFYSILHSEEFQLDYSTTEESNHSIKNSKTEFKKTIEIFIKKLEDKSIDSKKIQFESFFSFLKSNMSDIDYAITELYIQESSSASNNNNCFSLMMIWILLASLYLRSEDADVSKWIEAVEDFDDPVKCSLKIINLITKLDNVCTEDFLLFPVNDKTTLLPNDIKGISTVKICGQEYISVLLTLGTMISLLSNSKFNKKIQVSIPILEYIKSMKSLKLPGQVQPLDLKSVDTYFHKTVYNAEQNVISNNMYLNSFFQLLSTIIPNSEKPCIKRLLTLISEIHSTNHNMEFLKNLPYFIKQTESEEVSYFDIEKTISEINTVISQLGKYIKNSVSINVDYLYLYLKLKNNYINTLNQSKAEPDIFSNPNLKSCMEKILQIEEFTESDEIQEDIFIQINKINKSLTQNKHYFNILNMTKCDKWKYVIRNYFKFKIGTPDLQLYFLGNISRTFKSILETFISSCM